MHKVADDDDRTFVQEAFLVNTLDVDALSFQNGSEVLQPALRQLEDYLDIQCPGVLVRLSLVDDGNNVTANIRDWF
ncbi:MAG: hypothetical protein A4E42_00831 [Methanoregulaceae archaeon PtaU1.Bin222]|nr:MAG: hypothetical protein A4E42_00831 [Methanoregulaceae archaeon PtaU1.Bin222]